MLIKNRIGLYINSKSLSLALDPSPRPVGFINKRLGEHQLMMISEFLQSPA